MNKLSIFVTIIWNIFLFSYFAVGAHFIVKMFEHENELIQFSGFISVFLMVAGVFVLRSLLSWIMAKLGYEEE